MNVTYTYYVSCILRTRDVIVLSFVKRTLPSLRGQRVLRIAYHVDFAYFFVNMKIHACIAIPAATLHSLDQMNNPASANSTTTAYLLIRFYSKINSRAERKHLLFVSKTMYFIRTTCGELILSAWWMLRPSVPYMKFSMSGCCFVPDFSYLLASYNHSFSLRIPIMNSFYLRNVPHENMKSISSDRGDM